MIKKTKKGKNKREKGQALIESIVAMGIIVTGVLGAFSFFSSSISWMISKKVSPLKIILN